MERSGTEFTFMEHLLDPGLGVFHIHYIFNLSAVPPGMWDLSSPTRD